MVPRRSQQPSQILSFIHRTSCLEPGHHRDADLVWTARRSVTSRNLDGMGIGDRQCVAVWCPDADGHFANSAAATRAGHRISECTHGAANLLSSFHESWCGANLRV